MWATKVSWIFVLLLGTTSSKPRSQRDFRDREPDSSVGDRDGTDDYVYEEYDEYTDDYDDYYSREDEFGMIKIIYMAHITFIAHIHKNLDVYCVQYY